MTAAEVVGLSPDGSQLVLRVEGQTVEVALDLVRRAERMAARHLSRAADPTEPLTPRSIQQRIRCGESAEQIADSSGVPVRDVAKYEGPPLAEREHQAGRARETQVEDTTVAEAMSRFFRQDEVEWDAWLLDDHRWEVTATAAGQTVRLRWDALNRRVQAVDETGRAALRVAGPADDVLTSVLRPVGTGQVPGDAVERPRSGRAEVPLWDEISRQVRGRENS